MASTEKKESSRRSSSKVIVCHITTVHTVFDTRIFHKECVSLAKAGYETHLIARHEKDEVVQGVLIHALPSTANRLRRIFFLPPLALLKALKTKADVYHFHDPELIPIGAILRLITHAKVICDHHEDTAGQIMTKYWIPKPVRGLISTVYRLIEAFALIGTGVIETDMIEGRYRQPVQSVRNLPLLGKSGIVRRNRDDFEGKPVLVYVGGVNEVRGIWNMLTLAKNLLAMGTEFEMHIVGPVDPLDLTGRMKEFIQTHGLGECVVLRGRTPHPEAMSLIRTATAGLCLIQPIPNYLYALPTKILEYMTYGLPVIASDLPCTREYVNYCRAGILVDPGDPERLANQVSELLADPDRMLQLANSGQKTIAEELNWEKESELLIRFYQRLFDERIPPDPCWPHRRREAGSIAARLPGKTA